MVSGQGLCGSRTIYPLGRQLPARPDGMGPSTPRILSPLTQSTLRLTRAVKYEDIVAAWAAKEMHVPQYVYREHGGNRRAFWLRVYIFLAIGRRTPTTRGSTTEWCLEGSRRPFVYSFERSDLNGTTHSLERLIENPWARRPIPSFEVQIDSLRMESTCFKYEEGLSLREIFHLPRDWPER